MIIIVQYVVSFIKIANWYLKDTVYLLGYFVHFFVLGEQVQVVSWCGVVEDVIAGGMVLD